MRKLMLKIATAALLTLVSIAGTSAFLPAETVVTAQAAVVGSHGSVLASDQVSDFSGIAIAGQTVDLTASINGPTVDLITAGACAALIGCCILGLALLRLRFRGDPRFSWSVIGRRALTVARPLVSLRSAPRPSLTLLSISRV